MFQPFIDLLIDVSVFLSGPVRSRPVEELLAHRILSQPNHPRPGQFRNVIDIRNLALRQQCAVRRVPPILPPGLRVN
jgi:hypothetical protein